MASQQLLIPETFELKPSLAEILRHFLEDLRKVGLEVDDYGGNSFAIKSVPQLLESADHVALIQDLIETMTAYGSLEPLENKINEVLETMACHRQVRAGDRLSSQEIGALMEEMKGTPRGTHCPHGRPVVVEVTFEEIEKWFKRRGYR